MSTEPVEKEAVDPTTYLDKAPTVLQDRFATWIKEEVGYNPATAKTKEEAFKEGVRIATATRMVFQASDYNRAENAKQRAANAEARAARAAAAEKAPKAEVTPAPAKAAKPVKAAKAAKAAPVAAAPAAEAAPAAATRRPARRAPRRAAETPAATEAPF